MLGVIRGAGKCCGVLKSAAECWKVLRSAEKCFGVLKSASECWGVIRSFECVLSLEGIPKSYQMGSMQLVSADARSRILSF